MKDHDENKNKKVEGRRWIADDIEDEYFKENRKSSKWERKQASAKDRSKYKKTDWEKFKKSEEIHKNIKLKKEQLLQGRVLSIVPEGIIVEHENVHIVCTLRGLLKKEKTLHKNLVTVGDFVLFEKSPSGEGLIAHVEPRKTVLSRADNLSRRKEQLIAANIDQVLITSSVVEPVLKFSLIDRYIIASRKGGMTPIVVINKIDLLEANDKDPVLVETEKQLLSAAVSAYASAHIPVILVSTVTGEGLEDLKQIMKDKASVFSGQSGVGKSSLINAISTHELEVGDVVEKTRKGSHTTTTTKLLPLDFGGWCIDTPGIKSFGVWSLEKDEVEQYFEEIYAYGRKCKYPDCSHMEEGDCAVHMAVEKGLISPLRYESYLALMDSISQEHLRR